MARAGGVYIELGFSNINGVRRLEAATAKLAELSKDRPELAAQISRIVHDIEVAGTLLECCDGDGENVDK